MKTLYNVPINVDQANTEAVRRAIINLTKPKLFRGAKLLQFRGVEGLLVEKAWLRFDAYVGTHTLHPRVVYLRVTADQWRFTLRLIEEEPE